MKLIVSLILTLLITPVFGQITLKEFKKTEPSLTKQLEIELGSKEVESYELDATLSKAAQIQADYLINQPLSIKQKSGKNKTVEKRIKSVKGDFDDAIQLVIEVPFDTKQSNKEITAKTLGAFDEYLESHLDSIPVLRYNTVGFGWSKRKSKNVYILSVVFAHKKTRIEGQQTKNAFSLQKGTENCTDVLENHEITILTSCVYISGNKVMIDYQNKDRFMALFPNAKDGIAIDIISESQFPCHSSNELDQSPIYDGVILKPIFRDDFIKNNESEGDFRIKTTLGEIPSELMDEAILPNLIYIRNGQVCKYSILHYVDGEQYGLAPIEPMLDERDSPLKQQGSVRTIINQFAFEQGQTTPLGTLNGNIPKDSIMAIEVISYSSIEGNEIGNRTLHEERAKQLLALTERKIGRFNGLIKTSVSENWEHCYLQLELLGLDSIAKLPKDTIRLFVLRDQSHNWDSLLAKQRISTLIIHIKGTRDSLTQREDFLNMNIRTALLEGNSKQANRAMLKMYRDGSPTSLLMEPGILDRLMKDTSLVQNASAMLTNHFNPKDIRILGFVRKWLREPGALSENATRNLIHLYNLSTYTLLEEEWDIKTTVFLKLLDPKRLDSLFSDRLVTSVFDLNYYLTRINYHELTGDFKQIRPCFNKIKTYFESQALTIAEEVKIAKFFNLWSQPFLTVELLQRRMDNPDFTPDAAFLLAQTMAGETDLSGTEAMHKAAALAYKLSPDKWCEWVNFDFQLYRDPVLKAEYCVPCREGR